MTTKVVPSALIDNSKFHARPNHVEIHLHFVREKVLSGEVEIKHCNTKQQYEDFLTNSVLRPKYIQVI